MGNDARLSRVLSGLGLTLGLWLLLSPVILTYPSLEATAQQTVIGVIVTLIAGVRLSLPHIHWPSWISVILSAELILMPLRFPGSMIQWNATIVGLVLLAISLRSASKHRLFPRPSTQ